MSRLLASPIALAVALELAAGAHAPGQSPARPQPITFEPTAGVPTFAVRPPVLRLKPGAVVQTRTFSQPGDYYEQPGGRWQGEVGPF